MTELKTKTGNLTDHVTEYIETYLAINVLKATDKAAGIASQSIASVLLGIFAFFFLFLISIGIGYWLGQKLDNMFAGFTIIAGFYGLLAVLIAVLRKNVLLPLIKNRIIKSTYE